jgi:hypothetical protein
MIHDLMTAKLLVALNVAPQPSMDGQLMSHHLDNDCRHYPIAEFVAESSKPTQIVKVSKKHKKRKRAGRSLASLSKPISDPAVKTDAVSPELADEIARAQYWSSFDPIFKPKEDQPVSEDLGQLEGQLTQLQFGFMNIHMASLRNPNAPMDNSPLTTQALAIYASKPTPAPLESPIQVAMSHPTSLVSRSEQPADLPAKALPIGDIPEPKNNVETQIVETPVETLPEESSDFAEAFTKGDVPVLGAWSEMRTIENVSRNGIVEGWQLTKTQDGLHWPTLNRVGLGFAKKPVKLVHSHVIRDFDRFMGIQQDPNLGIVMVELASGWDAEFSAIGSGTNPDQSAAGTPIYFDSLGNYIGREGLRSNGTAAYPNAIPGFRMIYLTLRDTSNPSSTPISGSVAFPVFPGVMTTLDFTEPNFKAGMTELVGKVTLKNNSLAGESSQIVNGTARVVGSDRGIAHIASDGTFKIPDVITFAGYPIFVEIDAVERNDAMDGTFVGLTHRYQLLPRELKNAVFPRQSREKVQNWIDQLPSGVSDKGGFAVVNASKVISAMPNAILTPSIEIISSSAQPPADPAHYGPKTCALAPDERLQIPRVTRSIDGHFRQYVAPMQRDEKRFVGMEIPDGLFEAKLFDENGNVVWSMLAPSSPEVINVLKARK